MPYMLDDPADMTPTQRRREIAVLLARGVLRLRQCAKTSADLAESRTAERISKSGQNGLDGAATSSPHVPAS